jgi:hypothetical protein
MNRMHEERRAVPPFDNVSLLIILHYGIEYLRISSAGLRKLKNDVRDNYLTTGDADINAMKFMQSLLFFNFSKKKVYIKTSACTSLCIRVCHLQLIFPKMAPGVTCNMIVAVNAFLRENRGKYWP